LLNATLSLSDGSDCDESTDDGQGTGQDRWQIAGAHSRDRPHGVSFSENNSKDAKPDKEEASIKVLSVFGAK
jgi:hypothetical protein